MSVMRTVSDMENAFLSRREIVCDFVGLGGKLKRADAVRMITEKFGLADKTVLSVLLKNHVGRAVITGTFYVYADETLAKKHVNPAIFARLDKEAQD